MDLARTGHIALIMLSPTLAVAAAIYTPRVLRVVWNAVGRPRDAVQPHGRAIEALAADLHRLLLMHDSLKRSTAPAVRARRLRAIEAAITDCATEAAHALAVPVPDRPVHAGLPPPQLRQLLRSLDDAGLALPRTVHLLATDRRP